MRCFACDDELTDHESTRKSTITNEYLDLCDTCFKTIADDVIKAEEQQEELSLEKEE